MGSVRTFAVTEGMGSADGAFDKDRIPKKAGDPTRREFTYFMLGGARFIYASSARLALIKVCKEKSFLEVRTIPQGSGKLAHKLYNLCTLIICI